MQKIAEAFEIQLSELVDLSDKGNLNVSFAHHHNHRNTNTTHQNHVYVGSCAAELKEQKLINELKDKEIAMKDREIENLREIIALLKDKTNHD